MFWICEPEVSVAMDKATTQQVTPLKGLWPIDKAMLEQIHPKEIVAYRQGHAKACTSLKRLWPMARATLEQVHLKVIMAVSPGHSRYTPDKTVVCG